MDPSPWILVIDDDRWTREALVSILRRAGYQVTTQERFGQELEAGQFPERYQVAVLDYHLPDLNGLEVARRLKQFQPDCRIVMISSELPNLPELAGQEAVVDRFLAKPFSKDAILEVIAQLCPVSGEVSPTFLEDPAAAGDLPEWVLTYARREGLFTTGDRVLVAVSGGPDSVALLHLLVRLAPELGLDLGVAHFDHGLRGEDSRADADFVADLARRLGLPCHQGRGQVRDAARRDKVSLQMAARKLRLQFLQDTRRRHGYAKLALGHTADDQVELFWLRLLRGAGLEGLKGMWPATPEGLVRPLLAVGKAVLLAWLEQEALPYRLDASNLSRAYLRNRVRLDLLPHLTRSYNPRLAQTIWRTQSLLQEDERLLARDTAAAWDRVARRLAADCFALDLNRFFRLEPALQRRVLRAGVARLGADVSLTAPQVASLMALAGSERSGGLISLGEKGETSRWPGREPSCIS